MCLFRLRAHLAPALLVGGVFLGLGCYEAPAECTSSDDCFEGQGCDVRTNQCEPCPDSGGGRYLECPTPSGGTTGSTGDAIGTTRDTAETEREVGGARDTADRMTGDDAAADTDEVTPDADVGRRDTTPPPPDTSDAASGDTTGLDAEEVGPTNRPGGAPCSSGRQCLSRDCSMGTCSQTIFVTASEWTASAFSSLSDFDDKCQTAATMAGLRGTWRAVISDEKAGIQAIQRVTISGPVYNRRRQIIASNKAAFWGTEISPLQHLPGYDAMGNQRFRAVWTASDPDGSSDGDHCNGWSSSTDQFSGETGLSSRKGPTWINNNAKECDTAHPLYCIDGQ